MTEPQVTTSSSSQERLLLVRPLQDGHYDQPRVECKLPDKHQRLQHCKHYFCRYFRVSKLFRVRPKTCGELSMRNRRALARDLGHQFMRGSVFPLNLVPETHHKRMPTFKRSLKTAFLGLKRAHSVPDDEKRRGTSICCASCHVPHLCKHSYSAKVLACHAQSHPTSQCYGKSIRQDLHHKILKIQRANRLRGKLKLLRRRLDRTKSAAYAVAPSILTAAPAAPTQILRSVPSMNSESERTRDTINTSVNCKCSLRKSKLPQAERNEGQNLDCSNVQDCLATFAPRVLQPSNTAEFCSSLNVALITQSSSVSPTQVPQSQNEGRYSTAGFLPTTPVKGSSSLQEGGGPDNYTQRQSTRRSGGAESSENRVLLNTPDSEERCPYPCVFHEWKPNGEGDPTPHCRSFQPYVSRLAPHHRRRHQGRPAFVYCPKCFRTDFTGEDDVTNHHPCEFRCVTETCRNYDKEPRYRNPCDHGLVNAQKYIWRKLYRLARGLSSNAKVPDPDLIWDRTRRRSALLNTPQQRTRSPDVALGETLAQPSINRPTEFPPNVAPYFERPIVPPSLWSTTPLPPSDDATHARDGSNVLYRYLLDAAICIWPNVNCQYPQWDQMPLDLYTGIVAQGPPMAQTNNPNLTPVMRLQFSWLFALLREYARLISQSDARTVQSWDQVTQLTRLLLCGRVDVPQQMPWLPLPSPSLQAHQPSGSSPQTPVAPSSQPGWTNSTPPQVRNASALMFGNTSDAHSLSFEEDGQSNFSAFRDLTSAASSQPFTGIPQLSVGVANAAATPMLRQTAASNPAFSNDLSSDVASVRSQPYSEPANPWARIQQQQLNNQRQQQQRQQQQQQLVLQQHRLRATHNNPTAYPLPAQGAPAVSHSYISSQSDPAYGTASGSARLSYNGSSGRADFDCGSEWDTEQRPSAG